MNWVDKRARAAAAGACALITDGDEDAAQSLLGMYLADVMPSIGVVGSLQRLVSATLGVACAVADDADEFRQIAARLACDEEQV